MSEDPTVRERGGGGATAHRTPDLALDSERDEMPLMIGRFTIEDELGVGGMGRVYLAYDPSLDRRVALKLIREESGVDTERAHVRMAREARAMARLQHPNVVTVYEVGKHEKHLFIVMEMVAGGTLRRWIDGAGELDWKAIVEKCVAAGRGLAAAHAAGLVHRDFKPDNVLLDGDRVLVSDFGIANVYGDALATASERERAIGAAMESTTRTGSVVGTPPYMSPEQHAGEPADARTDQFAFCVVLYEALYGVRPFAGDDHLTIAVNAVQGAITPPKIDRDVPARVHDAIARGLSSDPAMRFPNMTALFAELVPPSPSGNVRRIPWLPLVGGVALAAAATSLVWFATQSEPAAPEPVRPCDCEVITFEPPPGGRVVGGAQLALSRGHRLITYVVDGTAYHYSVVSRGINTTRTLPLPAPVRRDGFVFVAGGEVPIGDPTGTDKSELPVAFVHLAPYLISIREHTEQMTFTDAVARAKRDGERLPFASEWEWAARLGVIEGALGNTWEWTATRFGDYPYDDERDDPLADGKTAEIRGGQRRACARPGREACGDDPTDRPRISRRAEGARGGLAELRRARSATLSGEVAFDRDEEGHTHRGVGRLNRWVQTVLAQDAKPALQVRVRGGKLNCETESLLLPFDKNRMEILGDPALPAGRIVVRLHPSPSFSRERGRVVCTDTVIEILDMVCFEGTKLAKGADATIAAAAGTLERNPTIRKLEVGVHVGPWAGTDAQTLSQDRAEIVRARLVSLGVDPKRLEAHGYGSTQPILIAADERRILLGSGVECKPGDRVEFLILERKGQP